MTVNLIENQHKRTFSEKTAQRIDLILPLGESSNPRTDVELEYLRDSVFFYKKITNNKKYSSRGALKIFFPMENNRIFQIF